MQVERKTLRHAKQDKYYFSPETQIAIVKYQSAPTIAEKNEIYTNDIRPAFEKLVENLIFIHGFAAPGDTQNELKNDCITFLFESLHKFDGKMGTKAFSYFNVVAKNWLIIRSKQRLSKSKRNVSLDELREKGNKELEAIERGPHVQSFDEVVDPAVMMERVLSDVRKKLTTSNEIACMNAIQSIVDRIDEIDILNKRAIFLYIREMTDLTPKQLSSVMSNVRKYYKETRNHDED